jgi:hypothetical protein
MHMKSRPVLTVNQVFEILKYSFTVWFMFVWVVEDIRQSFFIRK